MTRRGGHAPAAMTVRRGEGWLIESPSGERRLRPCTDARKNPRRSALPERPKPSDFEHRAARGHGSDSAQMGKGEERPVTELHCSKSRGDANRGRGGLASREPAGREKPENEGKRACCRPVVTWLG